MGHKGKGRENDPFIAWEIVVSMLEQMSDQQLLVMAALTSREQSRRAWRSDPGQRELWPRLDAEQVRGMQI